MFSLRSLFVFLCAPYILLGSVLQEQMIKELDIIKNSFEVKYAPAEWKKTYCGLDLNTEIEKAKSTIQSSNNFSIKDFQHLLRRFFTSFKDYHVEIGFYSTEYAYLPFDFQSANGRYFLTDMDSDEVPSNWKIGDEIIAFNKKPIQQAMDEFKSAEFGNPGSLTDQSFAEMYFTMRSGLAGVHVPSGPVTVTIKHASGETKTYKMSWQYISELVQDGPYAAAKYAAFQCPIAKAKSAIASLKERRQMVFPFYSEWQKQFRKKYQGENRFVLDDRQGFLPLIGQIIWKSGADDYFYAYICKTPGQRTIGYIRIPDYLGGDAEAKEFAKVIKHFQGHTDGLVIDQQNNPGGDLYYMYALASTLSPKPLKVPLERFTLTQEEVYMSIATLAWLDENNTEDQRDNNEAIAETIGGYPITPKLAQQWRQYHQFIIDQWNSGKSFTDLCYCDGIDFIDPCPTGTYSKPILILSNSLSISCGDFFPAVMQDNKRAVIMGTKTAGAGGIVHHHQYPNRFGILYYSYTGSLAIRDNKDPLENLGVTPDITYNLTERDLQKKYPDYVTAIQAAIEQLVPASQSGKPKPKPR